MAQRAPQIETHCGPRKQNMKSAIIHSTEETGTIASADEESRFSQFFSKPNVSGYSSSMASDSILIATDEEAARPACLQLTMVRQHEQRHPANGAPVLNPNRVPLNSGRWDPSFHGESPLSEGSKLHGTGRCKPCAWFWKDSGCILGRWCDFCHACPKRALGDRRRAKTWLMRQAEKAERMHEKAGKTQAIKHELPHAGSMSGPRPASDSLCLFPSSQVLIPQEDFLNDPPGKVVVDTRF
eukprot:TRINITY_DN72608_c0_g1_i1.p1 TRINITY_DN72608_c0_g1~~TRINITY_DN72608_c0_g1_i1.p1  ORF type:complete len:273 (+),score=22.73 TRINITY_DN72608_c0_g1_i1:101-820(+)